MLFGQDFSTILIAVSGKRELNPRPLGPEPRYRGVLCNIRVFHCISVFMLCLYAVSIYCVFPCYSVSYCIFMQSPVFYPVVNFMVNLYFRVYRQAIYPAFYPIHPQLYPGILDALAGILAAPAGCFGCLWTGKTSPDRARRFPGIFSLLTPLRFRGAGQRFRYPVHGSPTLPRIPCVYFWNMVFLEGEKIIFWTFRYWLNMP
jgi:hypothetical protein